MPSRQHRYIIAGYKYDARQFLRIASHQFGFSLYDGAVLDELHHHRLERPYPYGYGAKPSRCVPLGKKSGLKFLQLTKKNYLCMSK